jgi:two-component system OmpR family response regulator
MRILLVEDDVKLARALARGLRRHAYAVDLAADGDAALMRAAVYVYDLVVLDVMLPGRDGLAVCAALRERGSAVPVLMLTAREGVRDRIRGLDAGADDYLAKPFDFGELLARMRALQRRPAETRPPTLRAGELVVDPATHAASVADGRSS